MIGPRTLSVPRSLRTLSTHREAAAGGDGVSSLASRGDADLDASLGPCPESVENGPVLGKEQRTVGQDVDLLMGSIKVVTPYHLGTAQRGG